MIPSARLVAEAGVDVIAGRAATVDLARRRLILDSGSEVEYVGCRF